MNSLLPSFPRTLPNSHARGRRARRALEQLREVLDRVSRYRDKFPVRPLRFAAGADVQKTALAQNLRQLSEDIADLEAAIRSVRPFIKKKECPLGICDLRLPIADWWKGAQPLAD